MELLATTRFAREPDAVPAARAFVKRVLRPVIMAADPLDRLVLAFSEACNNVVHHATGDMFTVRVFCDDDACLIEVTDRGRGFRVPPTFEMPPVDDTAHRGLALMHALVDRVEVDSSPTGTAVLLSQARSPERSPVSADR